jgi:ABC-type multidrug transport system permease subunit
LCRPILTYCPTTFCALFGVNTSNDVNLNYVTSVPSTTCLPPYPTRAEQGAEILYAAHGRRGWGRAAYPCERFWTVGRPSSAAVLFLFFLLFFFFVSSLFYFSFLFLFKFEKNQILNLFKFENCLDFEFCSNLKKIRFQICSI